MNIKELLQSLQPDMIDLQRVDNITQTDIIDIAKALRSQEGLQYAQLNSRQYFQLMRSGKITDIDTGNIQCQKIAINKDGFKGSIVLFSNINDKPGLVMTIDSMKQLNESVRHSIKDIMNLANFRKINISQRFGKDVAEIIQDHIGNNAQVTVLDNSDDYHILNERARVTIEDDLEIVDYYNYGES